MWENWWIQLKILFGYGSWANYILIKPVQRTGYIPSVELKWTIHLCRTVLFGVQICSIYAAVHLPGSLH